MDTNKVHAVLAAVALIAQVSLVGVVGYVVGRRLAAGESATVQALACLLVAVGEIILVLQVLGAVMLLQLPWVLGFEAAIALAVVLLVPLPAAGRPTLPAPWLATLVVLVPLAALALVLGLDGPSREFDTVHYHVVNAASWLHSGSTLGLPFSYAGEDQASVPGNGELLGTWLMLPSGDDAFAYIGNVAFGSLAVLGIAALAEQLGGAAWLGALAGASLVASPLLFWTQAHSLLSDMPAIAGIAAGTALVMRAGRDPRVLRWIALGAFGLGFAAGSKYTALPVALAGGVLLAWVVRPRGRQLATAVLAFAAPCAFWYVRNVGLTGNPIFPTQVSLGGHVLLKGPTGPLSAISTPLADHILHARLSILQTTGHLLLTYLGPFLLLAAAGVACTLMYRRNRRLATVGAYATVCTALYTVIPITGGGPDGLEFLIGSNLRYLAPALAVMAAAGAAAWPRPALAATTATLAYDAYRILQGPSFRPDLKVTGDVLLVTAVISGAVLGALYVASRPDLVPRRRTVSVASASLVLAGVCAAALAASPALAAIRHPSTNPIVSAADAVGSGAQVALINVDNVRDALPPSSGINPVGVGDGSQGSLSPAAAAQGFQHDIDALHPGVVVVGSGPAFAPPPAGWTPPSAWRNVGTTSSGATVYVVPTPSLPPAPTAPPVTPPPVPTGCPVPPTPPVPATPPPVVPSPSPVPNPTGCP